MPSVATIRTTSARELAADAAVHLLGLGLVVPAAIVVVVVAALSRAHQLLPAVLYAVCMLAMFGCSAAYNMLLRNRWRDWLQRFDHAAIFAMIAGSYSPFTFRLESGWAAGLTASVWGIAGAGIASKLCWPTDGSRLQRVLSVGLYLALGWIGVIAIGPFINALGWPTVVLIGIGGAIYSAGVIFHLWNRLPYQNAIWHGFVLLAAIVHYAAVCTVL